MPARRLVVVDIENLLGGACLHRRQVKWAKSMLSTTLSLRAPDHVVVGISHVGLLPVGCNWPRIRYVVRSGPDGADLALLDVLDEDVSARFDEVVIASGDGAFTAAVWELEDSGVSTTVLARPGTLARSLESAASRVLYVRSSPPNIDDLALAQIASDRDPVARPTDHQKRGQTRLGTRSHTAAVRRGHRRSIAGTSRLVRWESL